MAPRQRKTVSADTDPRERLREVLKELSDTRAALAESNRSVQILKLQLEDAKRKHEVLISERKRVSADQDMLTCQINLLSNIIRDALTGR